MRPMLFVLTNKSNSVSSHSFPIQGNEAAVKYTKASSVNRSPVNFGSHNCQFASQCHQVSGFLFFTGSILSANTSALGANFTLQLRASSEEILHRWCRWWKHIYVRYKEQAKILLMLKDEHITHTLILKAPPIATFLALWMPFNYLLYPRIDIVTKTNNLITVLW